ncbi:hypothetical protein DMI62_01470 [Escherichia coli]|nr:hypothetical protein [Escherichia coli]
MLFSARAINPGWLDNRATSADYQFRQMGSGWLANLMLSSQGVLLLSLISGDYWWIVIIPVGAHISFRWDTAGRQGIL